MNSMDNLLNSNVYDFEPYMFDSNDQEERKVHTPYVQPLDFSFENQSNIKPISSKIQFSLSDIAMVKKAKSRKTKTIQDPNSNKKCGHWSSDQNKRYHWFLEFHHEHFINKHLRRTDRIFKSMASFVQTREAEQCRSHHQKMEKKYKYFSKILMSLRLQNYNNDDRQIILEDMNSKGHNTSEIVMLSGQQLRAISQNSNSQQKQIERIEFEVGKVKAKMPKSQISATTLPSSTTSLEQITEQSNKQQQAQLFGPFAQRQDDIDNIFNDTYQKNIDLGDLGAFY